MLADNHAAKNPHTAARVGGHLRAGHADGVFFVRGSDTPAATSAKAEWVRRFPERRSGIDR
jgi:hypothetical protein